MEKQKTVLWNVICLISGLIFLYNLLIPTQVKSIGLSNTDAEVIEKIGPISDERSIELEFDLDKDDVRSIQLIFDIEGDKETGAIEYQIFSNDENSPVLKSETKLSQIKNEEYVDFLLDETWQDVTELKMVITGNDIEENQQIWLLGNSILSRHLLTKDKGKTINDTPFYRIINMTDAKSYIWESLFVFCCLCVVKNIILSNYTEKKRY